MQSSFSCFLSTGAGHSVIGSEAFLHLGERNDIAEGFAAGHQHDQAVETERKSSVRRGSVFERRQQMAEAGVGVLLGKAKNFKHAALHLLGIDTKRAAANLGSVKHNVVRLCAAFLGLAVKQVEILLHRCGEGVVLGRITALLLAVLEKREIGDPQELIIVLSEQAHSARNFHTERAPSAFMHVSSSASATINSASPSLSSARARIAAFSSSVRKLRIGRRHGAVLHLKPRKTFSAVRLDIISQGVDLFAAHMCAAVDF